MKEGIKLVFKKHGLVQGRKFGKPSEYLKQFPESDVCFDAQAYTEKTFCTHTEVIQSREEQHKYPLWTGDIDMTFDRENLQEVANELGHNLYVTDMFGELGWIIYCEE